MITSVDLGPSVAYTTVMTRPRRAVLRQPQQASSGKTTRHRLNRGGDRQANAALYRIALSRLRWITAPATTSTAASPKAKPAAKPSAASSDTSPARSTRSSRHHPNRSPQRLDIHRGIRPPERPAGATQRSRAATPAARHPCSSLAAPARRSDRADNAGAGTRSATAHPIMIMTDQHTRSAVQDAESSFRAHRVDADKNFFRCTAWRDLAEHITGSLGKGDRVVVTGRLRSRTWETETAEKRTSVEIEVDDIGPSLKWAPWRSNTSAGIRSRDRPATTAASPRGGRRTLICAKARVQGFVATKDR